MPAGTATLISGDAASLLGALPIESGSVRSRPVFAGPGARLSRLTLDEGQILKKHTTPVPILVQVLEGHAAIDVASERIDLPTGSIVHVDANLAHSIEALTPTHLLLTLCERTSVVRPAPPKSHRAAGRGGTVSAASPLVDPAHLAPSNVVLASSGTDSDAIARVTARHAELSGSAAVATAQLLDAVAAGDDERIRRMHASLLRWCRGDLHTILESEQSILDPVISEVSPDIAARLHDERDHIASAIARLAAQGDPVEIATAAVALRVQVSHHLRSFGDSALAALAGASTVSLAALWTQVETGASGESADRPAIGSATCECGIIEEREPIELDVREVPHEIRHATVFGALDGLGAEADGLILVAPHDPLPLLAQLEQRAPGRFTVDYLDRGPDAWRLRILRQLVL